MLCRQNLLTLVLRDRVQVEPTAMDSGAPQPTAMDSGAPQPTAMDSGAPKNFGRTTPLVVVKIQEFKILNDHRSHRFLFMSKTQDTPKCHLESDSLHLVEGRKRNTIECVLTSLHSSSSPATPCNSFSSSIFTSVQLLLSKAATEGRDTWGVIDSTTWE